MVAKVALRSRWAALARGHLACWPAWCGARRPGVRLVGLVWDQSELGVRAFELGVHVGEEVRRTICRLELESTSPEVEEGRLSSALPMVGRKELDRSWKEERRKKNREGGKRKWEEKRKKRKRKKKKKREKYPGLGSSFHVIRFFALLIFFSEI